MKDSKKYLHKKQKIIKLIMEKILSLRQQRINRKAVKKNDKVPEKVFRKRKP